MSVDPLVSVVIPTHNREDFIASAIDSVLGQAYQNIDIVVVDDGSTDGTVRVLSRFADRITVVSQTASGPGAARNAGVRRSTGDFVAFLDSDDMWLPGKLQRQMKLFSDPNVGMVGCGERGIDLSGNLLYESPGRGEISFEALTLRCANMPGGTSGLIVRRELLEKHGLFDPSLPRSQDWDLMLRLARTTTVSSVREVGVVRRVHTLPRPNASLELSRAAARQVIERHVPSGALRARALAWTDYDYARAHLGAGRWMRSFALFLRSYGRHAANIPGRSSSEYLKCVVERGLPAGAYRSLSHIYRRWLRRG